MKHGAGKVEEIKHEQTTLISNRTVRTLVHTKLLELLDPQSRIDSAVPLRVAINGSGTKQCHASQLASRTGPVSEHHSFNSLYQYRNTMKYYFIICLSILFTAASSINAFATEKVVRLTFKNQPKPPLNNDPRYGGNGEEVYVGHFAIFDHRAPPTSQELSKSTFTVYTMEEVESIRATDQAAEQKRIAELQDTITALRKDVKALSDVKDALTVRLDELEKRIMHPNSVSEP